MSKNTQYIKNQKEIFRKINLILKKCNYLKCIPSIYEIVVKALHPEIINTKYMCGIDTHDSSEYIIYYIPYLNTKKKINIARVPIDVDTGEMIEVLPMNKNMTEEECII